MQSYRIEKDEVQNKARCCYFDEGSLQVIGVRDLKIPMGPLRMIYIYFKEVFEGLVTYSRVKRINRGETTRYIKQLTLITMQGHQKQNV